MIDLSFAAFKENITDSLETILPGFLAPEFL